MRTADDNFGASELTVTIRTNPASPHPTTGGVTRLRPLRMGRRTRGTAGSQSQPGQEGPRPGSKAHGGRSSGSRVYGRSPIKLPLLCCLDVCDVGCAFRCSPSTVRTNRRRSPAASSGTRGDERSAALALPLVPPAPLSVATRALGRLPPRSRPLQTQKLMSVRKKRGLGTDRWLGGSS